MQVIDLGLGGLRNRYVQKSGLGLPTGTENVCNGSVVSTLTSKFITRNGGWSSVSYVG